MQPEVVALGEAERQLIVLPRVSSDINRQTVCRGEATERALALFLMVRSLACPWRTRSCRLSRLLRWLPGSLFDGGEFLRSVFSSFCPSSMRGCSSRSAARCFRCFLK